MGLSSRPSSAQQWAERECDAGANARGPSGTELDLSAQPLEHGPREEQAETHASMA